MSSVSLISLKSLLVLSNKPSFFISVGISSAKSIWCQMYTFYCLLRRMKGLFFLRRQMYTFGRTLKNKIEPFSVARSFLGYTGKYIVCLSRTEEAPAWMGILLNKNLKFRTYKFAGVGLPRLVQGFFTNLALKHFGSIFELPYQFNGTKTREYD